MIAPPWVEASYDHLLLGVAEIPGEEDDPRIIEYHACTTLKATRDEVPWCSSHVNWAMLQASVVPTYSAAARSWLTWGTAVSRVHPPFGAVGIFQGLGPPDPEIFDAAGHVGFLFHKADSRTWLVLGGNQGNRVCLKAYPSSELLGARWLSD